VGVAVGVGDAVGEIVIAGVGVNVTAGVPVTPVVGERVGRCVGVGVTPHNPHCQAFVHEVNVHTPFLHI